MGHPVEAHEETDFQPILAVSQKEASFRLRRARRMVVAGIENRQS
jgi:hypothetical protein